MKFDTTKRLPVVPVRDIVARPNTLMPIYIGRDISMRAVELAQEMDPKTIVLVTQRDSQTDDPQAEDLYDVGTYGTLKQVLNLPDGTRKIFVECIDFCEVNFKGLEDNALWATIKPIKRVEGDPAEVPHYKSLLGDLWLELTEERERESVRNQLAVMKSLSDLVQAVLQARNVDNARYIEVMRQAKDTDRAESVLKLLQENREVQQVRQRIEARVKNQMEKNQREYYLNEQMKAIRRELGEVGEADDEMIELQKRIEEAKLPKHAHEQAINELKRLKSMPPMSSEASVVRGYLDTLLQVPWNEETQVNRDLSKAREILEADHYGLEKIKERILEYLAVQKRVGKVRSPILCFVGAPGVGKTSLGQSIARATGREYVRMALGGVHDESEIRGHRRTYVGSMPGQIIKSMIRAGVKNPLFLLDEIDKIGHDHRGDPAAALLEVLDPEQNKDFADHYMEVSYDLSDVMFVATSNSYNIPEALLDRMEVISLSGYTEDEKCHIAQNHLIPKQLKANGLTEDEIKIEPEVLNMIIRHYTREAGVRGLERAIGKVMRKVVLEASLKEDEKAAEGKKRRKTKPKAVTISTKNLPDYLGAPKYTIGLAHPEPRIGVVNGLAWSSVGGDILKIETQVFPGKGQVQRTGSLGDVMKESVETARSVVRAHAERWGIDPKRFHEEDLHVHFPEGATPKDGPSAGIATTLAIYSAMAKQPVRSDIAMTGEINLHGEVLEIGGLKEKILAAIRGGCRTVLIPKGNVRDLAELPEGVTESIEIIPVESIDEVLKHAVPAQGTTKSEAPMSSVAKKSKKSATKEVGEKVASKAKKSTKTVTSTTKTTAKSTSKKSTSAVKKSSSAVKKSGVDVKKTTPKKASK